MIVKGNSKTNDPKRSNLVESGIYPAHLIGVKQFANQFGERLGFVFRIAGGPSEGITLQRSTGPHLSKRSKLAEVVEGMLGRDLTDQELKAGIDLDELVGNQCNLLVVKQHSKEGQIFSNIDKIFQ